jgi:hypothetical protein
MKNYAEKIQSFYEYVYKFYNNEDGLFPLADMDTIVNACNQYLESKPLSEFYFDSFDREEVRMIIDPNYSIF